MQDCQGYFDYLIDLALDYKDFRWIKELQQKKNSYKQMLNSQEKEYLHLNNIDEYENQAVVLEDMINDYGNLTENGIININFQSDDNIIYSNVIQCDKKYKKGERAKYKIIDECVQSYIKGYWIGYKNGSGDNSSNLNYYQGFFDGYNTIKGTTKIITKNIEINNNDNEKHKKWWQFWK